MKIVVLDALPILESDEQQLRRFESIEIYNDTPTKPQIIERVKHAELIICNFVDISAEIITAASNLRYIIVTAVGYDTVDMQAAKERKIKIINCPTQNAAAVANFTITLLFALTRKIVQAHIDLQSGAWDSTGYRGIELQGRTLGLLGNGTIAKQVRAIAEPLGLHVRAVDSASSSADVDTLVSTADIVSIHMPYSSETKHFLDARRLGLIKKDAYLINTARGGIIDQTALIDLLDKDHFAGVALDVYEGETYENPMTAAVYKLGSFSRVITTPHIAYDTHETAKRLGEELLQNVTDCLQGEPKNVVNH